MARPEALGAISKPQSATISRSSSFKSSMDSSACIMLRTEPERERERRPRSSVRSGVDTFERILLSAVGLWDAYRCSRGVTMLNRRLEGDSSCRLGRLSRSRSRASSHCTSDDVRLLSYGKPLGQTAGLLRCRGQVAARIVRIRRWRRCRTSKPCVSGAGWTTLRIREG